MVRAAPKVAAVMREVNAFVGGHPLVAHNAAFDKKFWDAELQYLKIKREQEFICSLLLSRRIYPAAGSHKLSSLAQHLGLPGAKRYHRALADAQVTAHLLLDIAENLRCRYKLQAISNDLLLSIQITPLRKLSSHIEKYCSGSATRALSIPQPAHS
jgi:DNA polymerase-3 subunit epsilon